MSNQVVVKEKNITDNVLTRVQEMENKRQIFFPPNYSPENALKSAWLILQDVKTSKKEGGKPVLEACSQSSIANTLLDMVVQGLNPVKNQCYFVAYGKTLTLQRSYLGTMAIAKRLPGVKDISFQVIYEGDQVEIAIENGQKVIESHVQEFDNIDNNKIKGAYCVITFLDKEINDYSRYTEIMTMNQIKSAWNQGQMKGNSGAHNNFTDQMVLKTVINRACKFFVNSSDDSSILTDTFSRTSRNESPEVQYEILDKEVEENQATEYIDVDIKEIEENTELKPEEDVAEIPEPIETEGPGF